ncbi:MAG: hypothetical protein Fues2KO_10480 [Fuerstiella sp.]
MQTSSIQSELVNVLLLEDDDVDARRVQRALKSSVTAGDEETKFQVQHVTSVINAVYELEQRTFTVILCDLHVQDSCGIQTIRQLIKAANGCPVIALTGLDDERSATQALRCGAADYLNKSEMSSAALTRAIRYTVERCRVMDRLQQAQQEHLTILAAKQEAENRAALADELREARDRAEEANRAKGEFLANMSHELRTPLHGILSFAGFGLRRFDSATPGQLAAYFTQIQRSGQVLMELVTDILDLSKLDAGKMQFDLASVDLRERIETQIAAMSASAAEKEVSMHFSHPTNRIEIFADSQRLDQLIRNLLSNAIKFTSAKSSIDVLLTDNSEIVELSVTDSGPGIPAGEEELVFEKFTQSSATKTAAGGTGLGLSIARQIVEGHGGTLMVTNLPSRGACFSARFPRSGSQPHSSTDGSLERPERPKYRVDAGKS